MQRRQVSLPTGPQRVTLPQTCAAGPLRSILSPRPPSRPYAAAATPECSRDACEHAFATTEDDQQEQCRSQCGERGMRGNLCHDEAEMMRAAEATDLDEACPATYAPATRGGRTPFSRARRPSGCAQ